MNRRVRIAAVLTGIAALLATAAASGGLLLDGLYRDNLFVTTVWRATDRVTLFVVIPILVLTGATRRRGSTAAFLVWAGILDYLIYNSAFYLFAAAFNGMFPVYVLIINTSAAALILLFTGRDVGALGSAFAGSARVRIVAIFLFFVALGLTTVYLSQIAAFIAAGRLPAIIELTGHPTNVVFALDLTLVVPVFILAGILLWRKRTWGYILAGMGLVKGLLFNGVLAYAAFRTSRAGVPDSAAEIPIWIGLGLGSLAALGLLMSDRRRRV